MADNKIIVDVEIKDKGTKELKSIKNNFKEYTKEIDKNRDAQAGLDQLTGGAISKFKNLKGQVLANFKAIGLLTKGLGKFKLALLSTGIGALVVAVGVVAANWEKITDFINGTNRELLDLEENTKKLIETTNDEITLLEKQKQLIELQGGSVDEVNDKLLQKFEIQKKSLEILLRELELELEVTKEQDKQVSLWESIKLGATAAFNSTALASEYTKSITEESEKTKEIQDKIQETKSKILDLDIKTLKITTDKGKKEKAEADKKAEEERKRIEEENKRKLEEENKYLEAKAKLEDEYFNSFLSKEQQEINAVRDKYFSLIQQAEQYGEDASILEEAQQQAIADIKKKYDDIEAEEKKKKDEEERAERLKRFEEEKKIEEQKRALREKTFQNAVALAGEESRLGKAILVAKTLLGAKEQMLEIQKTYAQARSTVSGAILKGAEAQAAVAAGSAETLKIGFPQNIPMIIAYAAQAVGVISAIKAATSKAKNTASSVGGAVGGGGEVQAPNIPATAPAFNVVGASGANQLAEAIAGQQQQPIKAFVVSNDVSTAQELDRNIVTGASIG